MSIHLRREILNSSLLLLVSWQDNTWGRIISIKTVSLPTLMFSSTTSTSRRKCEKTNYRAINLWHLNVFQPTISSRRPTSSLRISLVNMKIGLCHWEKCLQFISKSYQIISKTNNMFQSSRRETLFLVNKFIKCPRFLVPKAVLEL